MIAEIAENIWAEPPMFRPVIQGVSSVASVFYNTFIGNYTLIHALQGKRLAAERVQFQNSTLGQAVWLGVKAGSLSVLQGICLRVCLGLALAWFLKSGSEDSPPATSLQISEDHPSMVSNQSVSLAVFRAPIVEEFLFREVFQKSLSFFSPSLQIVIANTCFGLHHFPFQQSYMQVIKICLFPTESILYHITGGLIAPIVAHMTNNAIVVGLRSLSVRK